MRIKQMWSPSSTPTCRFSDIANPHKLYRRLNPLLTICVQCKGGPSEKCKYYYYCSTCNLEFHRACRFFPPQFRHPFHIIHPLTLISLDNDSDYDDEYNADVIKEWNNGSWDSNDSSENNDSSEASYSSFYESDNDDASLSVHRDYDKCNCCQRRRTNTYYYCSICDFSLNSICVQNLPRLTITHLKCHDHPLTLFPRRLPSPCAACGFSLDSSDFVYTCLLCNYMLHKKCIYLPRVIKITRHFHRLALCSSRPTSGRFSCGVCRKPVDKNHGQYSCNKGCAYAVHSKCATRDDVWDGKDLEDIPEEDDEDENVEPFLRIDEETIQYFSHDQHYLRFYKKMNHRDEKKYCEACCLPMTVSDSFYSCMECNFVLHEACACLPRKKYHPLHKHPLILHPFPNLSIEKAFHFRFTYGGIFRCDGCDKLSCGFQYKCSEERCEFELDFRCASLSDPLIHDIHPHGLFFNLTQGECMGLNKSSCSKFYLECLECKFFICLYCATVPCVAHYEHDRHPLSLCYGEKEKTSLQYWCEMCESKLDSEKWFYSCGACSVTLHVSCLMARNMFVKPNHTMKVDYGDAVIVNNNGNSRPICRRCGLRCTSFFILKLTGRHLCHLDCLEPLGSR